MNAAMTEEEGILFGKVASILFRSGRPHDIPKCPKS